MSYRSAIFILVILILAAATIFFTRAVHKDMSNYHAIRRYCDHIVKSDYELRRCIRLFPNYPVKQKPVYPIIK